MNYWTKIETTIKKFETEPKVDQVVDCCFIAFSWNARGKQKQQVHNSNAVCTARNVTRLMFNVQAKARSERENHATLESMDRLEDNIDSQ